MTEIKVPKQITDNLAFRKDVIDFCSKKRSSAAAFWKMSQQDLLFYINTFVWTYDPRRYPSAVPFVTYDFQDQAFHKLMDVVMHQDLLIDKSRDMGASWMCVMVFEWFWHFYDNLSFLMISRKEDLVDKTEDPQSLFWKIDFSHKHLPRWLKPKLNRQKLHLLNLTNNSTIDGCSTTGDMAHGDRRTAILLDEFGRVEPISDGYKALRGTRDATECRIFNSTPNGTATAFYATKKSGIEILVLDWKEHPRKKIGLYTSISGKLEIIDKNYVFPADYDFILDGKIRSLEYDKQWHRCANPEREMSEQWDRNDEGSGGLFFDSAMIERLIESDAMNPIYTGEFGIDSEACVVKEFIPNPKGKFKLWTLLDGKGKPSNKNNYVVGVDISAGTGASNSVISVYDMTVAEKVCEYVDSYIKPQELAKVAIALCRFFAGPEEAFLIWEATGSGRNFGDKIIELGYRRLYYKTDESSISPKQSDIPGLFPTKQTKKNLLSDYAYALRHSQIINRSEEALKECREYIYDKTGYPEHSRALATDDSSGARENHGDRVIADALCAKIICKRSVVETIKESAYPEGSYGWRREKRQKQLQTQDYY